MRSALFILPFIALFVGAICTAIGSAFQEISWITYAGWSVALAIVLLWVGLDLKGFKALFTRKGAKYGFSSGISVLLGVLVIIAIGYLSSKPRFNKSYDATKAKLNTLSDQSIKLLDNLKEKQKEVTVLAFFKDEDVKLNFKDLIDNYRKSSGADVLKIEYVDPQSNPTRAIAEKVTPSNPNTVIFRLGAQEVRLSTFTEEKITNALVQVSKEGAKTVYFTKGHGEGELKGTDASGYSAVVQELENNKYTVKDLALLENVNTPDNADLIVIAGPKYDFKAEELSILEKYLERGGALLVMIDAMASIEKLNAFLNKWGLNFNSDLLILKPDDPRSQMLGQNNAIITEFDSFNPVTKDYAKQSNVALLIPNTRSISEATGEHKLKVELVGKSSDMIVRLKDVRSEADLKNINESRVQTGSQAVIAVASGKVEGQGIAANDKGEAGKNEAEKKTDVPADAPKTAPSKETRIVAIGSSQIATNYGAQRREHMDLVLNAASYLMQDEDAISIRPKDSEKTTISLATPGSQLTLAFLAFIYPFLYLGGGIVYWLKRRRM